MVPDACWHALMTWFFDKKHNNMYQRCFVSILETSLKQGSEVFFTKILIKLNLIGSIYESFEQVYKNEVPFLKLPVESFFYFIIKIIKLIENCLQVFQMIKNINNNINKNNQDYKNDKTFLIKQVRSMSSWKLIMKMCHK